MMMDLEDK
jgi:hypothetical protein